MEVLTEALRVTKRGGHIFVGDVRSLGLLKAYHASVQVYKADPETSVEELGRRIRQAEANDKEMVLNARLFAELGRRFEKLGRVETSLKPGAYDNELSRFRYDVLISVGDKVEVAPPERWVQWDKEGRWPQEVERWPAAGRANRLARRGLERS